MSLPTGTVTLLFADVERSVRLWEADREAMRTAMKALEERADEAVEAHGGARPVEQGEGDNLVAAFVRASDALACAVDIQLATEHEADDERPRLRVAIHTGEVELRDEGRYEGETMNRCARLRDSGHGGQILVSRTTRDLIADRLPDGATLTRLGTYRLRDMARPEEVYQVDHPDLPSTFPPLSTLGGPPTNLPRQLTSFVGRKAEMAAVTEILTEARLVTLTGSGGCGKTRLGVQVAASLVDDHPDGVWWVDLARVSDPVLVPNALAVVLGVSEPLAGSVADAIRGHLSASRSLVVLDNCEHLIEACAELAGGVLASCPDVRILATSREPLGVVGEVAWRVPSLEVPEEGEADFASLSQCEAVRLFIDRALQVRPNFQVTNDNAPAVAEICSRLDGIPLAIELAASRTRMMTPSRSWPASATASVCWPAAAGACCRDTPRCGRRSSGATTSSLRRGARCSTGSRCSAAASPSMRPRTSARATASSASRCSRCSPTSSTARSSRSRRRSAKPATGSSRRSASTRPSG